MQNYKQLRAWQAASELSQMVLDAFPVRAPRSIPGLRAQILRAAPSARRIEVVRRMLIALRATVQRRLAEDMEAARQRSNMATRRNAVDAN